ncbi:MAG: trypsin-like peptidase domain-containing protein [Candidatus Brocadiia bacterium]
MKKDLARWPATSALIILIGLLSAPISSGVAEDFEIKLRDLMADVRPAFVFIGGGSGAIISPDGYMVSNAHVVGDKKHFTVRLGNGKSCKAYVVGLNREGDLALLKIQGVSELDYLPLGDSDALRVGSYCVAVGNPLALGLVDQTPTFTIGVLSAKHLYRGIYNDALVTDVPVNPGNSGGPLVDMNGHLVGVNGSIETRWGLRANTGIGLAVPSNQIKRWLPHLKKAKGKNVPRGHLFGIEWEGQPEDYVQGAIIRSVAEGSPASKFGLTAGDVIVKASGQPVWNVARFKSILAGYPAGSDIELTVQRDAELKEISVKVQKPPKAGFKLSIGGENKKHVVVKKIEDDCAAAKAGLLKGDLIIGVGQQKLNGPPRRQLIVASYLIRQFVAGGREVTLTVERSQNGKAVEKKIKFFPGSG